MLCIFFVSKSFIIQNANTHVHHDVQGYSDKQSGVDFIETHSDARHLPYKSGAVVEQAAMETS